MSKNMSDLAITYRRVSFTPPLGACGLVVHGVGYHGRDTHAPVRHPHWRQDSFGMVLLIKGAGFFESAAATYRHLVPGDLIVCFPELWHNYGPVDGGQWLEYYCFFSGPIADTLRSQRWLDHRRQVLHGLGSPVIADFQACLAAGEQRDGHLLAAATYRLITHALQLAAPVAESSEHTLPALLKVVERICAQPGRDWNFHEVAATVGMRYDAFRHAFRRHFALAPHAFLQRERIHRACQLLGEGRRVNETCHEIGMHDPFHFSRLFKRMVGQSPRAFARRMLGVPP